MSGLWFRKRAVERDIDDELRFHFDARIEELVAQGASREAARAQALAEFGDVNHVRAGLHEIDKRVARRRSRAEVFDVLRQDLVYAARSLRRSPIASLAIIITLALGLGANAAMFSLLDVLFLRPPAGVEGPHEVRRLWSSIVYRELATYSPGFDYATYENLSSSFAGQADAGIYRRAGRLAVGRGENLPTANVFSAQPSYFGVLGVKPALGRFYDDDEARPDRPDRVAVISHAYWRRAMDADPNVIGRQIILGGVPFTIVGVAGPRFSGVDLDAADVWLPLGSYLRSTFTPKRQWHRDATFNGFRVLVRLRSGAREPELEQRATLVVRRVALRRDTTSVVKFGSIVGERGPAGAAGEVRIAERLAGVAAIVLIIACANVVNLLLARAVQRRREIAVRLALGISRSRLVRLLVTESVLLSIVAAIAALGAAAWGGGLLRKLLMPDIRWADDPLHWRVFFFAIVVAVFAGAVLGLVPALQSLAPDLTKALKAGAREGGAHRSRLRGFLVASQAALSVVLVVGALLFVQSLRNARAKDIGFAVDRLAFVSVSYRTADSLRDAATSDRLLQLEQRIARIPGVDRVAYSSERPLSSMSFATYFVDGVPEGRKKPPGLFTAVSPGYFEATGTKLLSGRTFAEGAAGNQELAVVVNQAMVDSLWPNQNPLGRCIRIEARDAPCVTVIGVAQTAVAGEFREGPRPHMYFSLAHMPLVGWGVGEVVLRVDPRRMATALSAVQSMFRAEFSGSVLHTNTMAAAMEPHYRPWQIGAALFTLFGALAALIAAIGIYSSVSYAVSQRTHEFGVRAALGADEGSLLRSVMGAGVRLVAVGVVAGIILALAGGRFVASLLYDVSPGDPLALGGAGIGLLVVAAVASLVPARRAARSDPVAALRADS